MASPSDHYEGFAAWPDIRRLAGLLGASAVGALIPERLDPAVARGIQSAVERWSPATTRRIADKMRRALPPSPAFDADSAAESFMRMFIEDAWGRSRGMWRFGWRPQVRIEGLERLDKALSRGRGAILWCLRFASATAIKQAFFHAGRPLTHLSRIEHGSPTVTRVGVEWVAPLYCRAENPYLAERIIIPLNRSPGYLKDLRRRLQQNSTVSMFAEHTGRQNITERVLTTQLEFAIGAPSLAWTEDAALLTVSAHREGPYCYRVVIGEEIPIDRSIPRKELAAQAVAELARRLEALIIRDPSDWQGWMYREFP